MKRLSKVAIFIAASLLLTSCLSDNTYQDVERTRDAGNKLVANQPTPTDIDYSLERYNLIRRAYWVNGEKEKARNVRRPAEVPMGYCVLFSYGKVLGQFNVDGKVTSLNSYLTASEATHTGGSGTYELPDIDGSYGENDGGVFFFTPQWQYIEWSGEYIYSDTPFKVSETILEDY
jgi:hypothetical protein